MAYTPDNNSDGDYYDMNKVTRSTSTGTVYTWSLQFNEEYYKRLQEFYARPWYKRIFRRVPR